MTCPNCKRETAMGFFCHGCDAYLSDPGVGSKAGVARRLGAQLLDGVVIWVVMLLVIALSAGVAAAGGDSGGAGLGTFLLGMVGYVVFAFWFLAQGKTPGKFLLGTRVVDKSNGSVPGIGRMLVRETIGKMASGFFLGLGYFWSIWDKDAQAWHDKIAGTLVVRGTASVEPAAVSSGPRAI